MLYRKEPFLWSRRLRQGAFRLVWRRLCSSRNTFFILLNEEMHICNVWNSTILEMQAFLLFSSIFCLDNLFSSYNLRSHSSLFFLLFASHKWSDFITSSIEIALHCIMKNCTKNWVITNSWKLSSFIIDILRLFSFFIRWYNSSLKMKISSLFKRSIIHKHIVNFLFSFTWMSRNLFDWITLNISSIFFVRLELLQARKCYKHG